jgi:hypothetical protein
MKTAVLGLAVVGSLLAAGAANATVIADTTSGASDLILFVQDTKTLQTYALDTNVLVSSVFSVSSTGTNTSGAVSKSIGPDANLTTFLSSTSGDPLQWAVMAASFNTQATGAALRPTGNALVVTTAGSAATIGTGESQLTTQMPGFTSDITALNSFGMIGATRSTLETGTAATSGDGIWGTAAGTPGNQNWYGATPDTTGILIGATQTLFGVTGNGKSGGFALNYSLGSVSLAADGTLTISTTGTGTAPPVPLPAALWVFGSGLLGLFGVGRRRNTANA